MQVNKEDIVDKTIQEIQYRIEAMDCPTEEGMIRKRLGKMDGITELQFNLIQRILTVRYTTAEPSAIKRAIESLGFETKSPNEEFTAGAHSSCSCSHGHGHDHSHAESSTPAKPSFWKQWGVIILASVIAILSEVAEFSEFFTPWAPMGLAIIAIAMSGISTYKKGWLSIIHGSLNINALMSIAVTGALVIGVWAEAAMVMVLFTLAEKLEGLSLDRARNAIKNLMDLSPERALVLQKDGSWKEMNVSEVVIGSTVRVRPGGRVSHDGEIIQGVTTMDQSAITGESLPIEKGVGDGVFAGTVNQQGEILFKVTADASNSTLSRIIHLVEEAQANRSATQRFVDSFAKVYTPIVIIIALLVATIPPIFFGGEWSAWVYKALAMLIIACPCALVVSTPVTVVSGLARASRMGMVVKGGVFLEKAAKLKWVAFDKTGTITAGVPSLTDTLLLEGNNEDIFLAASLAHRSDHPISRAVATGVGETEVRGFSDIQEFQAILGKGTQGEIGGARYYLGNHRLIEELGVCSPKIEEHLKGFERQGKTTVMLATEERVLVLFAVADTIKETSQKAIAELHTLGVKTMMISGDNSLTAKAIAEQAGIDDARGNLLPEDKASAMKSLRSQGHVVGMAGDGINDAPALAHADIGIAMGGMGTDTAIEAADVIIMDDDIQKVPLLIKLSRRTRKILTQNITFALGIKVIFMVLTIMGFGSMWMAVFADMGASLLVVFNGLRLLKDK